MPLLLKNKKILITAGPTREFADPVRFLSNPSSGKVGLAIAAEVRRAGARVDLVLGPTWLRPPRGVRVTPVVSAREMAAAVSKRWRRMDAVIATAAVSDWRFARPSRRKEKKGAGSGVTVRLVRNPDILADLGAQKRRRKKGPVLIGFSLETERVTHHAREKLQRKNLDLIIGNEPASFSSERIRPTWIERNGIVRSLPLMTKTALAQRVTKWLSKILHE